MLYISALRLLIGLLGLSGPTNASPVPSISPRGSSEPQPLKMPFTKRLSKKSKRKGGDSVAASLLNDVTSYDITLTVGTPPQAVSLQLDTGSSDLWVLAPGACDTATCTCPPGGCTYFDLTQSTTALAPNVPFHFSYGSGDVVGDYISDNIAVGGANLTAVIIGVASEDTNEQRGILGVGLPAGETPDVLEHAGVLELLVSQGYISSTSYSLYLDRHTLTSGEVIFGGTDSRKYTGDLVALPIVPSPDGVARLTVEWTFLDISINGKSVYQSNQSSSALNSGPATLLDSGTTLAFVPQDVFEEMESLFPLTYNSQGDVWLGLCSIATENIQLEFGFGVGPQVTITVPASEIMRPFPGDSTGTNCQFGFQNGGTNTPFVLGDTFLTSAYAYYDFEAYTISLAQAKWT